MKLTVPDSEVDITNYDDESADIGGYASEGSKIEIIEKIQHNGEINRARYLPNNSNIIATKTISGDIYIFNREQQKANNSGSCKPDIICKGHTEEGYGLSWNTKDQGHLLSASDDGLICYWNINADIPNGSNNLAPLSVYHLPNVTTSSVIEDCAWSTYFIDVFGTVSDDKRVMLWDRRQTEPTHTITNAHLAEINTISFSGGSESLFATGSADKTVCLWDLRNTNEKLHTLKGHTDEIFTVSWANNSSTILGSAGADRRVNIWDISRIGNDQSIEDAEDGPPELLFIHGGHTNKVSDFSWNKTVYYYIYL